MACFFLIKIYYREYIFLHGFYLRQSLDLIIFLILLIQTVEGKAPTVSFPHLAE